MPGVCILCTKFHCYLYPVLMMNSSTKKYCLRLYVVVYKHACCYVLFKSALLRIT